MQEVPIYEFYRFGYNFSLLRRSAGRTAHGKGLNAVSHTVDAFLGQLPTLGLRVTETAANQLRAVRDELESCSEGEPISDELAQKVRDACIAIDTTVDAELQLTSAFSVTAKRFDLGHLLETQHLLFGKGVFNAMPDLCQRDFSEAAVCVAFERSTASAFHSMRGTEGMLKHYYSSIVKRNRLRRPMWAAMLDQLRARRDSPPAAILDHLDNIRANFRNPTQHPDAEYEIDEAQDLLSLSIEVVNRMVRDIRKRAT